MPERVTNVSKVPQDLETITYIRELLRQKKGVEQVALAIDALVRQMISQWDQPRYIANTMSEIGAKGIISTELDALDQKIQTLVYSTLLQVYDDVGGECLMTAWINVLATLIHRKNYQAALMIISILVQPGFLQCYVPESNYTHFEGRINTLHEMVCKSLKVKGGVPVLIEIMTPLAKVDKAIAIDQKNGVLFAERINAYKTSGVGVAQLARESLLLFAAYQWEMRGSALMKRYDHVQQALEQCDKEQLEVEPAWVAAFESALAARETLMEAKISKRKDLYLTPLTTAIKICQGQPDNIIAAKIQTLPMIQAVEAASWLRANRAVIVSPLLSTRRMVADIFCCFKTKSGKVAPVVKNRDTVLAECAWPITPPSVTVIPTAALEEGASTLAIVPMANGNPLILHTMDQALVQLLPS